MVSLYQPVSSFFFHLRTRGHSIVHYIGASSSSSSPCAIYHFLGKWPLKTLRLDKRSSRRAINVARVLGIDENGWCDILSTELKPDCVLFLSITCINVDHTYMAKQVSSAALKEVMMSTWPASLNWLEDPLCFDYVGNFGRVIVCWHRVNWLLDVHLRASKMRFCSLRLQILYARWKNLFAQNFPCDEQLQ